MTPLELYNAVRPALKAGRTVTFRASGGSMRPFIAHGQEVTLRTESEYRPGDVVLALTEPDGKVVMHYVAAAGPDGRLILMGAANLKQTEHCRRCDVAGRVVSPALSRRRIRVWHLLRPLRRLLLRLI